MSCGMYLSCVGRNWLSDGYVKQEAAPLSPTK